MPNQRAYRAATVRERGSRIHAKVMHLGAAFAGTRSAALWPITRLHTATYVHC